MPSRLTKVFLKFEKGVVQRLTKVFLMFEKGVIQRLTMVLSNVWQWCCPTFDYGVI